MNQRDQELLDKQLWGVSPGPPRNGGMISVALVVVFLVGIVFGNILGIASGDIVQMVVISAVTLLVLSLKWKDLLLFAFDPNQARAIGLNTTVLHMTLLTLLAATAVAALQTVGACHVVAMLVTPGATAYLMESPLRDTPRSCPTSSSRLFRPTTASNVCMRKSATSSAPACP